MKTFINKAFLVLACAAAMPFAKVDAQEAAHDITLSQARELALEHNKDIAKSKLTLEQTQNDAKAYKTNYYPRINLMAADFYSTTKGDFSIAGGHLPIYMLNPATGTYVPNVTMGADGNYILNQYADFYRMASRGAEMAEENIRLTESQVILNTDEAYMQAIRARQLADVARSYKQLLEELMKNVESAVRHGLKTRNDQMKVQVKLNEAELAIQRAENGIRLSTMNLCHVIGLPLNTPLQLDADQFSDAVPATIPTDGLSIDARPESAILQAKTDIASQQVKLTRSDYLPQLAMFAGRNTQGPPYHLRRTHLQTPFCQSPSADCADGTDGSHRADAARTGSGCQQLRRSADRTRHHTAKPGAGRREHATRPSAIRRRTRAPLTIARRTGNVAASISRPCQR